jgi:hypothetical protein
MYSSTGGYGVWGTGKGCIEHRARVDGKRRRQKVSIANVSSGFKLNKAEEIPKT